jgi:hypothetical protein
MENEQPKPVVGMGVTMCYWSDRHAGTVIAVSESGREVTVQQDKAFRSDKNGMSEAQEYDYESWPEGPVTVFTLRKNGRFYQKGQPMGSTPTLWLGTRREFYDYSF